MYGKLFILSLSILVLFSLTQNANAVQVDPASVYYNDSGNYVPYKLTQNANTNTILTKDGSFVFDKTTCSLAGYDTANHQYLGSDQYYVLASQGNTGIWNPVSIINNAACTTSLTEHAGTISITGTKSVSGAGIFTINYTKTPLGQMKITFSATNQNPAWTNYHIGLEEKIQVPNTISLGNQTFDLTQQNNTVVNRAWITAHNSQLITLYNNIKYNMGIGWDHVSQIKVQYIGGKSYLLIDYTFNTPILSPGQTITVDPTLDTKTSINYYVGSTSATQTFTITVGSNTNRILIVPITMVQNQNDHNVRISSIKIGSTPFTLYANKTITNGAQLVDSEVWYLLNPPTGLQTITITPASTVVYTISAGAYSLYHINQISPLGATGTNSSASATANVQVSVTPTSVGSWIMDIPHTSGSNAGDFSAQKPGTSGWSGDDSRAPTNDAAATQYYTSPTIGSANKLTWSSSMATAVWEDLGFEVKDLHVPATPTISKVNTINSTAINATFNKPTGATFTLLNITLSGGSTTHINTTQTQLVLNNYTAGSKYTFQAFAGNASGVSSGSVTKYNYTYNIAPTSPTISSITSSSARLSWTNPTPANLTGGFKIFQVTPLGTNYTLAATTNNSTNHRDFTGLLGNRQYVDKISTGYAIGTNYTGYSSNSTTVSFYTLPGTPTSLTVTQSFPLHAHLSWTQAIDNGTVLGTKIERSTDGGTSWTTIVSNTGNSSSTYNDIVSTSGKYSYRVSTIKYGGTSATSNIVNVTIWDNFTVRAYHADGTTAVYGQAIQANSTSTNNRFTLVSGAVTISGISGNNNFTAWNSLINFIVGKQYNYNATSNHSLNMTTKDFDVDCPSTGTGVDVEVWTNGTNGHNITTFSTPTCFANNTMKWSTKFTANGNDLHSYNTLVYVRAVNATFGTVAPLKYNNTMVTTAFTDPYIVSNPVTVGTGLQTKLFNWSMNLTVSPAFTPVNFTVGHISVSGVNPVTAPIKFTTTVINSSATSVKVTFPSTYTMGYQLTFGNEGTSKTYTGLPVTSPSLGLSQSTITFLNPHNDLVTIKAYDIPTNTTARYILAQPNNQIPFVTQILNFKNGLFGTSAMIGGIDIVSLIILLVSMIGLNRANETVGAIMMVIIIGVCAYFGLIEWQTTMTASIALVVLVIVSSTKKLPWS